MARVEIRDARPDEWTAIFPIFREIVEEGTTYAYPLGLSLEQARAWWMEEPPSVTLVALEDDRIVASTKMGPNRPGRGSHVATASFMVASSSRGRGVGAALGRYVLERARAEGYRSMQFNAVVESNEAAVRLWQRLGFDVMTTIPEAFEHRTRGLVGLHVMYRPL